MQESRFEHGGYVQCPVCYSDSRKDSPCLAIIRPGQHGVCVECGRAFNVSYKVAEVLRNDKFDREKRAAAQAARDKAQQHEWDRENHERLKLIFEAPENISQKV